MSFVSYLLIHFLYINNPIAMLNKHAIIIDTIIHPTLLLLFTFTCLPVHYAGGLVKYSHIELNSYVEFYVPAYIYEFSDIYGVDKKPDAISYFFHYYIILLGLYVIVGLNSSISLNILSPQSSLAIQFVVQNLSNYFIYFKYFLVP